MGFVFFSLVLRFESPPASASSTSPQFACYDKIDIADMGTWQVQQDCCQSDGSWWCFEPTHLSKCPQGHPAKSNVRHDMPGEPDAIYRPMKRGGQPGKRAHSKNSKILRPHPVPGKPSSTPSGSPEALVALAELASASPPSMPDAPETLPTPTLEGHAGHAETQTADHAGQVRPTPQAQSHPSERQQSAASIRASIPPMPDDLVTGMDSDVDDAEGPPRSEATPEPTLGRMPEPKPEPKPELKPEPEPEHTPVQMLERTDQKLEPTMKLVPTQQLVPTPNGPFTVVFR